MPDAFADGDAIAIIGMAIRVPEAPDLDTFWANLAMGRESVTVLDEQALRSRGVRPERLADKNYVRSGAVLEDVDLFDAEFFGMTPRDAAATDPQIRIFLELAHSVLENAGYDPATMDRGIGVMAAAGPNYYGTMNLRQDVELAGTLELGLHTLNHSDYLATTVSYRLDLRGPSLTVLTACSGSLAALHLACQALREGECEAVIVGGANVEFPVGHGYLWSPGTILSRTGHCRPFDAQADGTVFGSGAAAVMIKPLEEARRDGDRVRAVIVGSAMNNDGADKVSFTAPSVTGQASMIMEAMSLAGVEAADIGYVEAHGTGTPVGDPMEVMALTEAYASLSGEALAPGSCAIGSVKGNIGHLGPVAGLAGLVKTVLALENEQLPPSINVDTPNPRLNPDSTPFRPVRELIGWPRQPGKPRLAGVSSLGIGGTNVHLIVAEAPDRDVPAVRDHPRLLVWSGRDDAACDRVAANLAGWLVQHGEIEFADGVATLQHGRTAHPVRRAVIARTARDARAALADPARTVSSGAPSELHLPAVSAGDAAGFRDLAREVPEFEAELRGLLARVGAEGDAAAKGWADGVSWSPVLTVAARAALARVWLRSGADAAAIRDPAGLPGVVGCAVGDRDLLAFVPAPDEAAGDGAADLWTVHLQALARLWVSGGTVDWAVAGCDRPRYRAALPGYPYARVRHWVDPPAARPAAAPAAVGVLWTPVWRDATADLAARSGTPLSGTVLVLLPDARDAPRTVLPALHGLGADVVTFSLAAEFGRRGGDFTGCTGNPGHLARALEAMRVRGQDSVLVLIGLSLGQAGPDETATVACLRALADLAADGDGFDRQVLVTQHAADVSGEGRLSASRAALALLSLADDNGRSWIDVGHDPCAETLGAAIGSAADAAAPEVSIVRGARRWVPDRVSFPDATLSRPVFRRGRPYLLVDPDGAFAVQFADAMGRSGIGARLLVATATAARTAELASLEENGPEISSLRWTGDPGDLPGVLATAGPGIGGAIVVGTDERPPGPSVDAATRALAGQPLDVVAAVRLTDVGRRHSAAEALNWAASSRLSALTAERVLHVTAGPGNAATGQLVLRLIGSPIPANVVSNG